MKKHIPNILTSLNLVIGSAGIFYVLTIGSDYAFYFVVIASVFDFFDGFVARLLEVKSDFGKELDSLADLVSFGLLPAFFMMRWIGEFSEFSWVAILIAVFSALRLAKFNLDDSQPDNFEGLPTPANALMLTSMIFLNFELSEFTLLGICVMSSFLLVSKLRLIVLKFKTFGWVGNEAKWSLIMASVALIIVFKWRFLPFLVPMYLVGSIFSNLVSNKG